MNSTREPMEVGPTTRLDIIRRRSVAALPFGIWLATLLWPVPARGQIPDLVDVSAQYMPSAALDDPRPTEAQVSSYQGSLNLPVPVGDNLFVIPGLAYRVESVSFSNKPPDFRALRAFHSLDLSLLVVRLLPRDWALSLRVAPGLAGDFHGFDSGLLRVNALALATHTFSSRFVLGGGAIASFSFGSLLPLPAIYMDWKPFDGFEVEAFVPAFVDAKYSFEDRIEIGLHADVAGNAYAVRDKRVAQAWPCVGSTDDPTTAQNEARADPMQCLDHVAYSVATAGATFGVQVVGSVWWTAFAGHSFYRRLEQLNHVDRRVAGGLQTLPNVFFVRTGLTWRIPRD